MSPRPTDRCGRPGAAVPPWRDVARALLNLLVVLGHSTAWLVGVPLLPPPEEEPEPGDPRAG